jgi:hypothetical protein
VLHQLVTNGIRPVRLHAPRAARGRNRSARLMRCNSSRRNGASTRRAHPRVAARVSVAPVAAKRLTHADRNAGSDRTRKGSFGAGPSTGTLPRSVAAAHSRAARGAVVHRSTRIPKIVTPEFFSPFDQSNRSAPAEGVTRPEALVSRRSDDSETRAVGVFVIFGVVHSARDRVVTTTPRYTYLRS